MVRGSTVLALNKAGNVYITKEYKYAVERDSVEIISGAIDEGETPLDAAQRELKEEAGLTAAKWTDLGVVDPFTTVINCPNHLFLAEDLMEGEQELDHNEVIEITKVPFEKAFDMAMKGEITHGASVVLILKVRALLVAR